MLAAHTHLFWLTSRAAGIGSLVLASVSVGFGLLMGGRMVTGSGRAGELRVIHEALSLATLIGIVVHGAVLLGDAWLHPGVLDVTVPFVGSYRPFWNGLGIIGGWILVVLGVSYYARARIGAARWRRLHRLTAVGWLLGLGHALGAGTDAGARWFLAMLALTAGPALVLLALRMTGTPLPQRRPRREPGPIPARTAASPAPLTARRLRRAAPLTPRTGSLAAIGLLPDAEGDGGLLVLTGPPPDVPGAAAAAVTAAVRATSLTPDGVSLPCFLARAARRAPAGAPLHAYVSPELAATVATRLDGRERWHLHVAPSAAAWRAATGCPDRARKAVAA